MTVQGPWRPLPHLDRLDTQPYWEAARRGRLVIQRCGQCRRWIWYPQRVCYSCRSSDLAWEEIGGAGTVYSFVVLRQALHPAFSDHLPLPVALVELDEAPYVRITANVLGCPVEEISVGLEVEVCFEEISEDVTLPQFRPRGAARAEAG